MSNALSPSVLHRGKPFQWYAKALCAALLLLTVSCTLPRSSPVALSLKVEPASRPGVFTVSGSTNAPEQSQIIVQGIRPLLSAAHSTNASTPNYAILDRQTVLVSKGHWQTTLKLWQSTPDGQYQEAWQANHRQLGTLKPNAEVIFLAAIDPGNQSKALKQQLEHQGKTLEGANVRFTTDEQWYLQAQQTLAVTPPIVKQTASTVQTNPSDGKRSLPSALSSTTTVLTPVNLPTIQEKQSTAPLSFAQRLR